MGQIVIELLIIHFFICFLLIIGDLIYGYRHGCKLDSQFIISTFIGGLIWPIGLTILVGINIYTYFKGK